MNGTVEKHSFQAEVNEVLGLVVNSLYSHREVFLRELISNASDAIDQMNFRALTETSLLGDDRELRIELVVDKPGRTLTIRDNGIGMSRDELIGNLGTIARSGSKKLMQSLSAEQKKDMALIGQFGVGFYSAFLVADRVTVISRKAGSDEAWQWSSEAKGDFEIAAATRGGRGTDIVLHLKGDAAEYLDEWAVRQVVRKYSDYVRWPIRMETGDGDERKWNTLNEASALWTRNKAEVTDEQYREFYRHVSHDWNEPLAWTHFRVEGAHELTGLLFVPEAASFDVGDRKARGVRLFVKRVFIMDDAQEILPDWLRFVRGVVDSEDLPLNVSREILQRDATTRFIRKQVIGKTLTLLEELAKEGGIEVERDGEKVKRNRYEVFWRQFGRVLKEGVYHDMEHRERLAGLLRFRSSRGEQLTGLQDYVGRMAEGQKGIYYVAAENLATARSSPHIEALTKQSHEVLFLVEPIDEWVVDALREFGGKPLISAQKGALDLPESDEQKKDKEQKAAELKDVLERLQQALPDQLKEVRVTDRLTDSPACLVTDGHGMSARQEQILRDNGQDVPVQKRILELNPGHPVVDKLRSLADAAEFNELASLLYDQSLLAEGALPADPGAFAKKIARLLAR